MPETILVVDPDAAQRKSIRDELERDGFRVLDAETGERGKILFCDHNPDLTIVEIKLPDMRGTQLCEQLKTDPALPGGLVVLTSRGITEVTSVGDGAVRHAADYFIPKPFPTGHLRWKIAELTRGRAVGAVRDDGSVHRFIEQGPVLTTDPGLELSRGDLGPHDPATLVFSFTVHRRSGTLLLASGDDVRQVVFRSGMPIAADSNVPSEDFAGFAVTSGVCHWKAMARVRKAWQRMDRGLGVVAVSLGVMGARQMFHAMRQHVETVLMGVLAAQEGEYFVEYGSTPKHFDAVALPELPAEYVMRGVRKLYDDKACLRRIGLRPLVIADQADFIVSELADHAEYDDVLDIFEAPTTLGELVRRGQLKPGDGLAQKILGLRTIGALWVLDEQRDDSRESVDEDAAAQPPPRPAIDEIEPPTVVESDRGGSWEPPPPHVPPPEDAPTAPMGRPVVQEPSPAAPRRPGPRDPDDDPWADEPPLDDDELEPLPPARVPAEASAEPPRSPQAHAPAEPPPTEPAPAQPAATEAPASTTGEGVSWSEAGAAAAEQGQAAFDAGEFETAANAFEQAVALQKNDANLHVMLSRSLLALPGREADDLVEAVDNLKQAIRMAPDLGNAYHFLGVALADQGRRVEARFALRKALDLGTDFGPDAEKVLDTL